MANAHILFKKIEFDIQENFTLAKIWFDSDEPVLTGTYRQKAFDKSFSIEDILKKHIPDCLLW